jgi:hypothetical protein
MGTPCQADAGSQRELVAGDDRPNGHEILLALDGLGVAPARTRRASGTAMFTVTLLCPVTPLNPAKDD